SVATLFVTVSGAMLDFAYGLHVFARRQPEGLTPAVTVGLAESLVSLVVRHAGGRWRQCHTFAIALTQFRSLTVSAATLASTDAALRSRHEGKWVARARPVPARCRRGSSVVGVHVVDACICDHDLERRRLRQRPGHWWDVAVHLHRHVQ